jgi:hypothetical protein
MNLLTKLRKKASKQLIMISTWSGLQMNMAQRRYTLATVWIYLVYSSCKNHKASEEQEEKNSSGGLPKKCFRKQAKI